MKFTDMLRALDDSDLDPFEVRYLIHIWRRGSCWESVRKISESCQMSKSQANRVRQKLIAQGWIIQLVEDGRVVQKVAGDVPTGDESNVVIVPVVDAVVPVRDASVPVRHALPINRTKEINPLNEMASDPIDDDRAALERAKAATLELMAFWAELTGRPIPLRTHPDNVRWFKAFNMIWVFCGRDVDNARTRIQAIRDDMLGRGITLFDPDKLRGHVKTAIDAELLPMTQRMNGYRQPAAPLIVMKEIAPGLF